jgi:8-oxo-dGTP pyrophosphatase MutT (NUDIX family)
VTSWGAGGLRGASSATGRRAPLGRVARVSWRQLRSRVVYENRWIRVREDEVVRPDGEPGIYGVVEVRNAAVFVVALTDDDEVVLITQERYTTSTVSIEVPAGGTDGEDPLLAAQRELREETGLVAATWRPLGRMHALNGVADAGELVFLATRLSAAAVPHDQAAEGITAVTRVPFAEVLRMIRDGEIVDGETIAALAHAGIALGRFA